MYKAQREFRDNYPIEVKREIKERAFRNEATIFSPRQRTEKEIEVAKQANPGEKRKDLEYVEEEVGVIDGLAIFRRNIRDVLILELERELETLKQLDPEASVHKLKRWYDWSLQIEDLFAEADLLIREGRKFFTKGNLDLIHKYLAPQEKREEMDSLRWNFDAPKCVSKAGCKRRVA